VDEHVFAYSNGSGPERSLVVFHDRFASTRGSIRDSAVYAVKSADGSKRLVRRSLAEGLGLPNEAGAFVIFRDARSGLESIRACRELWERGLRLSLDAYAAHVFWEFREVHDGSAGQWARLARRLGGAPVPSLDDAMRELQLEPVHQPFRQIFEDALVRAVLAGAATPAQLDDLQTRYAVFLEATAEATGVNGNPVALAAAARQRISLAFSGSDPILDAIGNAALLAWLALSRVGELAPGSDVAATSRAWYDELRLPGPLAAGLRDAGLDEGEAWAVTDLVRVLLTLPRPSGLRGSARTVDSRLLEQWLARDVVRTAIGLNTWQGVEYIDRDAFEAMLRWAVRLDTIDGTATAAPAASRDLVARLSAAAEAAGYRVDRLRAALAPPPARLAKPRARSAKPRNQA